MTPSSAVRFDRAAPAIVVENLTLTEVRLGQSLRRCRRAAAPVGPEPALGHDGRVRHSTVWHIS